QGGERRQRGSPHHQKLHGRRDEFRNGRGKGRSGGHPRGEGGRQRRRGRRKQHPHDGPPGNCRHRLRPQDRRRLGIPRRLPGRGGGGRQQGDPAGPKHGNGPHSLHRAGGGNPRFSAGGGRDRNRSGNPRGTRRLPYQTDDG